MSRANLRVRFPDGTVRHGIYQGASDLASPPLFATTQYAWDSWKAGRHLEEPPDGGDPVPVSVATDYGDGYHWNGTATPDWLFEGTDPCGVMFDVPWATTAEIEAHRARVDAKDGLPEWWR